VVRRVTAAAHAENVRTTVVSAASLRRFRLLAIVVAAAVVVLALLWLVARHSQGPVPRTFDARLWKAGDITVRGSMVHDLKTGRRLIGLDRPSVVELLGQADYERRNEGRGTSLCYTVDPGPRFTSDWTYTLFVDLSEEDGNVSKVWYTD
jgi:hypothetical protein